MLIFLTMLIMGLLLGFIGAGGSGFIIAILTVFFAIPIHIALGTSLAAMFFTSLSGAYSHYQEKNVVINVGVAVGLFGVIGSFSGSRIADLIPEKDLTIFTGAILFLSALLLGIKMFTKYNFTIEKSVKEKKSTNFRFLILTGLVGFVTGVLSGVFGIGSAPFIQIGLLFFLGLTIQQSVGTTLFIIAPMALTGGIGYYVIGNFDVYLFIKVAGGTTIGSYIGAKYTTRLNPIFLKTTIIVIPVIAGTLLMFG